MDTQIHDYLLAVAAERGAPRIGPFLVLTDPDSDNPYLNYAIPLGGAVPSRADVEALIEAFRTAGRLPRLEYPPAGAPEAEAALLAGSFREEARLELMVLTRERLVPVEAPAGFEVLLATSADELRGELTVVSAAYGQAEPPSEPQVASRLGFARRGGLVGLARTRTSGEPAASGICEIARHEVAELATVGTVPAFRRLGLAAAVTSLLAGEAFERDRKLLWLTPLHPQGRRIYERVGFQTVSKILHLTWKEDSE